ncbi:MAG: class I SAM-dependent methyltransferase, partial [Geminicoccaceae bacterium]
RQLLRFASMLKPGARVLELGSGGGHDAVALTNLGVDVTLVDGSASLAEEAEKRTGLMVRVLDFRALDYRERFDGIWASASLHHVSSAAIPTVFSKVARALFKGGVLFASFKEADTDWRDRFGRHYCAMTSDQLREHAEKAGLAVTRIERSEGRGYDGLDVNWLTLIAQRPWENHRKGQNSLIERGPGSVV